MKRRDLFKVILGTGAAAMLTKPAPLDSGDVPPRRMILRCGRSVAKSTTLSAYYQERIANEQRAALGLDYIKPMQIRRNTLFAR